MLLELLSARCVVVLHPKPYFKQWSAYVCVYVSIAFLITIKSIICCNWYPLGPDIWYSPSVLQQDCHLSEYDLKLNAIQARCYKDLIHFWKHVTALRVKRLVWYASLLTNNTCPLPKKEIRCALKVLQKWLHMPFHTYACTTRVFVCTYSCV